MDIKNIKVDYHRNGVGGEGFHVATFTFTEDGESHSKVGVVFDGAGQCGVFDIDLLSENNIEFANGNSWRGDHFEPALREAIKKHDKELDEKCKQYKVK